MARRKKATTTEQFEELLKHPPKERYVLKLFVSGASAKSLRAIENIKKLCEERLAGRYVLEVIDVYQRPGLVVANQILAAPTLVKELPPPVTKLLGDLSNEAQVLLGLDLE
ncbi:MAG: circadian clock KaiB family protein [Acidobacteriia bacterium]|nr:circadian clock KaiB family protein [Terriglobia bacterium]